MKEEKCHEQTVICSWNHSGTRLAISRSRFLGPASGVKELLRNNQFQPFSKEDKAEKKRKKQNKTKPSPKRESTKAKVQAPENKEAKSHKTPTLLSQTPQGRLHS